MTIPEKADAVWWQRHAHLLEMKDNQIVLREGVPLPDDAVMAAAPTPGVPFAEAFAGLVGQGHLLDQIDRAGSGGHSIGRPFPHLLLSGPPGTGKTTIAERLAAWLGGGLVKTVGPLLQSVAVLLQILTSLRKGSVLFLDEVHAIPRKVMETLYEALSAGCLTVPIRMGSEVRHVRFDLPAFTLVAATTEPGDLPEPLTSRFILRETLDVYDPEDLARIAAAAAPAEMTLDAEAARRLAHASRGTPREALRLLDLVARDAAYEGKTSIEAPAVEASLRRLGYDAEGLTPLEQRYLGFLRERRRPVSLARIALHLRTSARTIARDVEPALFERGLVDVTLRGRVALAEPASEAASGAPNVRQSGRGSPVAKASGRGLAS